MTSTLHASILTSIALVIATPVAQANTTLDEEHVETTSWREIVTTLEITPIVGGVVVDGDNEAFSARTQLPANAYGGFDPLIVEGLQEDWTFAMDATALWGLEDYDVTLRANHYDGWFVDASYRAFRYWYDPVGGYLPATDQLFRLNGDLFVDRHWLSMDVGMDNEKWLATIGVEYHKREGDKQSTIWGEITNPALRNPNDFRSRGRRGVVPSRLAIDEEQVTLRATLEKRFDNATIGGNARAIYATNDNTRSTPRNTGAANESDVLTAQEVDRSQYSLRAYGHWHNDEENLQASSSYSWTTLDNDIRGDRFSTGNLDGLYSDLDGNADLQQHIAGAALNWIPFEGFTISPAVRVESITQDSDSFYVDRSFGSDEDVASRSEYEYTIFSGNLRMRYTPIREVTFFNESFFEYEEGEEGAWQLADEDATPGLETTRLDFYRDFRRYNWKETLGTRLQKGPASLRLRGHYKLNINRYGLDDDAQRRSGTAQYPGKITRHQIATWAGDATLKFRPFSRLSFVTRVDYLTADFDTTASGQNKFQSGEWERWSIAESIAWTPLDRLSLLAHANYVDESLRTAISGTGISTVDGSEDWILPSDQEYWLFSANAVYALDEETELTGYYEFYLIDNFVDNSAVSVPYGPARVDHRGTIGWNRRFNENLNAGAHFSVYTAEDNAADGERDYLAFQIQGSIRYSF